MSNEFYDPPELLAPGIKARSADINQINQRLAAAFDKMPAELAVKGGFINFGANTGNQDNSYVVALASKITAYTDGLEVKLRPLRDNTGACSINVNSIGNAPIKRADGSNPQAGDLQSNATIYLSYSAALNAFILPPVVNSQLVIATTAAAAAVASRDEAQLWATSLAAVSGGLYGARRYANDAASSANTAAAWATSLASVDGTYYGARAYAIAASDSANTAQAWATRLGSAVADGEYSAKYWAQQAAATAAVAAVGQVQSNWEETSTVSKSFIWNKPNIAALIAATSPDKLAGVYVNGGGEKPSYFGSNKLRLQMLQGQGSNLAIPAPTWNDVLWMSSYGGNDVKGSNAIIMGKNADFLGFSRQDYDSGAWGALRTVWHSGNMVGPATGATPDTLVQRDSNGYINGTVVVMTDEGINGGSIGGVTSIITKRGDNVYRATTSAPVKTFLNYTGNQIATSIADRTTDIGVAGRIRWDKYGNNHTIVDFSNQPTTGRLNCNDAAIPWAPTYPMLVGFNGTDSFGMRVDSARVADSTVSAGKADFLNQPGENLIDISTPPSTFGRGISTSFASPPYGWFNNGGVIQFRPSSGSVGGSLQMYVPYSPADGGNTLRVRFGNYATNGWTGWKDLVTSENISSYTAGSAGTAGSATSAGSALRLQGAPASTNGADGWFRSTGPCGWFNSDYNVGIYATENGVVRTYNNASFVANVFYGSGAGLTGTASNLTVKDAGTVGGFAPQLADGATTIVVRDGAGQIIGTRVQAAAFTSNTGDNFTWNTYPVHHYGVTIAGNAYTVLSGFSGVAICTGGLERIGVAANGNVTVNQSLYVTGDITAFSDERVKTNWRPVCDDFVGKLAGVKSGIYDRTDRELTQVGVSAQSFKQVLPEAVPIDKDDNHAVTYGHGALVAAIELAKEVVALRLKVAALTQRFEALEK